MCPGYLKTIEKPEPELSSQAVMIFSSKLYKKSEHLQQADQFQQLLIFFQSALPERVDHSIVF